MNSVFVLTIQEPDCPICVKVFSTKNGAIACAVEDAADRNANDEIRNEVSENLALHGYAMGIDEVFYQIDECPVLHQ